MVRDASLRDAPHHEGSGFEWLPSAAHNLYPHPEERRVAARLEGCGPMGAWLYILRCIGGLFYTGTTHASLEQRVAQHQAGDFDGYTATRRPVKLVFSESFERITDAIAAEHQIKGWSRAKKEALIAGDFSRLQAISRRRQPFGPHPSRRGPAARSSG